MQRKYYHKEIKVTKRVKFIYTILFVYRLMLARVNGLCMLLRDVGQMARISQFGQMWLVQV